MAGPFPPPTQQEGKAFRLYLPIALKPMKTRRARPSPPPRTQTRNAGPAAATAGAYDGPLGRLGAGPEAVAAKIDRAISARRPRTRYPVTPSARLIIGQRRLLSDRLWDAFLRTSFPQPGKNP